MSESAAKEFEYAIKKITGEITQQMKSRGVRASVELRNNAMNVLRGQRTGRVYRVPYTRRYYTASAPGEPPAVRTGNFRQSWREKSFAEQTDPQNLQVISRIESGIKAGQKQYLLGDILEGGTGNMLPRPYQQAIVEKSAPAITKIYSAPY